MMNNAITVMDAEMINWMLLIFTFTYSTVFGILPFPGLAPLPGNIFIPHFRQYALPPSDSSGGLPVQVVKGVFCMSQVRPNPQSGFCYAP